MSNPAGFFNQVVTFYPKTSYDRYGRAAYDVGTTQNCRFQKVTITKLQPTGQPLTITGIVYCSNLLTIGVNDRISYNGNNYKVYTINEVVDGEGKVNHYKLLLTEWQEIT